MTEARIPTYRAENDAGGGTDAAPAPRARRPANKRPAQSPSWLLVAAVSLALLFFMFSFLAWRVRTGNDPVLSKQASFKQPAVKQDTRAKRPKRIIVIKRVIVTEIPAVERTPVTGTAPAAAAPGFSSPAPAPASAPIQAPAPAPSPPPVTRSS